MPTRPSRVAAKASGKKGAKPPSPLKTQTFVAVRSEASEVRREEILRRLVQATMVLISDGRSEHGARLWSKSGISMC